MTIDFLFPPFAKWLMWLEPLILFALSYPSDWEPSPKDPVDLRENPTAIFNAVILFSGFAFLVLWCFRVFWLKTRLFHFLLLFIGETLKQKAYRFSFAIINPL